jgi:hypothetical protein
MYHSLTLSFLSSLTRTSFEIIFFLKYYLCPFIF